MTWQVDSEKLLEALTVHIGRLVIDNESLRLLVAQRERELAEALTALARVPTKSEPPPWGSE